MDWQDVIGPSSAGGLVVRAVLLHLEPRCAWASHLAELKYVSTYHLPLQPSLPYFARIPPHADDLDFGAYVLNAGFLQDLTLFIQVQQPPCILGLNLRTSLVLFLNSLCFAGLLNPGNSLLLARRRTTVSIGFPKAPTA